MLVSLRNACWIFMKLSNKFCVCTFISASTYLSNGCKDTKKIFNISFVFNEKVLFKWTKNVRWDEIMRIASTQVVVTAKVETVDGQSI